MQPTVCYPIYASCFAFAALAKSKLHCAKRSGFTKTNRFSGLTNAHVIAPRRSLDRSPGTMVIGIGREPEFLVN